MNNLVSTSVLIIFALLPNFYLGSRSMTRKSSSDLQNWENEDQRKQVALHDTTLDKREEESWQLDGGENVDGQDETRIEMKQRAENDGEFLNELNDAQGNGPGKNSLVNGKAGLISAQRSKHNQSNRKRHNRKLKEEIEELHSEMRHVIADLDEISEKENELEHEIDELRQLRHTRRGRGKQIKTKDSNIKQRFEIYPPPVKNHKHSDSHSDLSGHDFGSVETEIQELEDEDAGSESTLLDETEDLRKDSREVFRKNDELRRKNKELCRLLHLSLITQGNGDFYEERDKLSSRTGESLEDQFLYACGRSYKRNKSGHKSPKLHSSEDAQKIDEPEREDARKRDSGKAGRINKKAGKGGRESPKTLSAYQDNKESVRQSHDHNRKTRKSERKLHKIKLSDEDERNSEYESEEEIILGNDKIETDETSSRLESDDKDQNNEKSESSISSAAKGLDKEEEEEVPLEVADYGKFPEEEEEEANMTISTDDGDKQKVYDHIASVDEIAFCGKPRPVVIYPSDHYPVPKKYYTPQGTILHRCAKHLGCCPNEKLTCVPAKKENVILHFFAAVLDGSSTIVPHIEKLRFVNHTKCGCVFKHHAHLYL